MNHNFSTALVLELIFAKMFFFISNTAFQHDVSHFSAHVHAAEISQKNQCSVYMTESSQAEIRG